MCNVICDLTFFVFCGCLSRANISSNTSVVRSCLYDKTKEVKLVSGIKIK